MQHSATLTFHGRLQQLLAKNSGGRVEYRFDNHPAIKDPIEALGIPHTEVDLILVDRVSVDFTYRLQDGKLVDVYPRGEQPPQENLLHLSPQPPQPPTFILDVHLGKLARRLRMLGFDCLYRNDYSDPELIQLAVEEKRIILTRDRGILKHRRVTLGYLVDSNTVVEQVDEVLARFELHDQIEALRRCPECNGLLKPVEKEEIRDRLQPKTARYYHYFQECMACGQLYWQGSHYLKIRQWIEELNARGQAQSLRRKTAKS